MLVACVEARKAKRPEAALNASGVGPCARRSLQSIGGPNMQMHGVSRRASFDTRARAILPIRLSRPFMNMGSTTTSERNATSPAPGLDGSIA